MKKNLTYFARKLRRNLTPHEVKLWSLLRDKRFIDLKFRRQYPIGKYIVDFCCPSKRLVIELDGSGHIEPKQTKIDKERDKYLNSQGFAVLRVWNNELDDNLDGVVEKIYELVSK